MENAKIAVLGCGTVGNATVSVFYENKNIIKNKTGLETDIKYILEARDIKEHPHSSKFIKDFEIIENDPEIKVVAELIGGVNVSYDFVKKSLIAGKSVVTSNKELVAAYGGELVSLAKENNVSFLFEASVGGGIPIIRTLNNALAFEKITGIAGILNGTTNYILTEMEEKNASKADVLKTAQKLGYAERNPEADIEGHDASRKIAILASLIFGSHVCAEDITTRGISNIELTDLRNASDVGCRIKLLARAVPANGGYVAAVTPAFVSKQNILSCVSGVNNAITVGSTAAGETMYYGHGAGGKATASAVVSDIINALKGEKGPYWKESCMGGDTPCLTDANDIKGTYYIRLQNGQSGLEKNTTYNELLKKYAAKSSRSVFIPVFENNIL